MDKRLCGTYEVQKALVPLVNGETVERYFILCDNIPVDEANFFLDSKSFRSINTGRKYAYSLCKFFNYLSERGKTYKTATNTDVEKFVDYLIFDISNKRTVINLEGRVSYSTVNGYIIPVTEFYRALDNAQETEIHIQFQEYKNSKKAEKKYLYGQVWKTDYTRIVDNRIRLLRKPKEKVRWLNDEQVAAIADNMNTLRDKAVFLITVHCGCRIGEVLSIMYSDYQRSRRTGANTVNPYQSKGMPDGNGRDVLLPEALCELVDAYIFTERAVAEEQSGEIFTPELFVTLRRGKYQGKPLQYNVYYGAFKRAVRKAGLDPAKYTTHDGRRTKVMSMLRYQSEKGELTDEMIRQVMGWRNAGTINAYKNIWDLQYVKSIAQKTPGFQELDKREHKTDCTRTNLNDDC